MSGQGRPQVIHLRSTLRSAAGLAVFTLVLCGITSNRFRLPGQRTATAQTSDSATLDNPRVDAEPSPATNRTGTEPLRFRWSQPGWPVTPCGTSGTLSVAVDALPELREQTVTLVYELIRVTDGATVTREQTDVRVDADGKSEPVSVASASPAEPGVYEIRCRLVERSDGIWSRFNRNTTELVLVRTPWLVHPSEPRTDGETSPSALDGQAVQRTDNPGHWAESRLIRKIAPEDWQSTNWMPTPASRIVPSVRRVGETLTWPAWQPSELPTEYTLKPGETWWGVADRLQRHRMHRYSVEFKTDGKQLAPIPVRIGWNATPQATDERSTVQCDIRPKLDLSTVGEPRWARYEWLHYPVRDTEFVSIRNDSTEHDVTVRLIRITPRSEHPSAFPSQPAARNVRLVIDSSLWAEELTPEFQEQPELEAFAASTRAMYRLWRAVTRLRDIARWMRCDGVSVPLAKGVATLLPTGDSTGGESASGDSTRGGELAADGALEATAIRAVRSWCDAKTPPITDSEATDSSAGERTAVVLDVQSLDAGVLNTADLAREIATRLPDSLVLRFNRVPRQLNADLLQQIDSYRRFPAGAKLIAPLQAESATRCRLWQSNTDSGEGLTDNTPQLSLLNTAPWAIRIRLQLRNTDAASWTLLDAQRLGEQVRLERNGAGQVAVDLPANTLLHLQSTSPPAESVRWTAEMVDSEKTFALIKAAVSELVGKGGTLGAPKDYDHLTNGGFESEGQVGIVGWMHTQFPESAVAIDAAEAIEGERSIRLTTDERSAGRTWLVSEPITVPESGRLAVSMATRSNVPSRSPAPNRSESRIEPLVPLQAPRSPAKANEPPAPQTHRVRVSLEGTDRGRPFRVANEFEVPCDGQWQRRRIVLETDQIAADRVPSVRLTIDSLSRGRLWVDDIHLHHRFATQAERSALGGKAFLAIQALQQGRPAAAADLLNNRWSHYLLAQSDVLARTRADQRSAEASGAASPASDSPPGGEQQARMGQPGDTGAADQLRRESVADRLRDWLPRPLRF